MTRPAHTIGPLDEGGWRRLLDDLEGGAAWARLRATAQAATPYWSWRILRRLDAAGWRPEGPAREAFDRLVRHARRLVDPAALAPAPGGTAGRCCTCGPAARRRRRPACTRPP